MIAHRQIYNVTSNTIKIQLPAEFQSKQVEIIILPIENNTEKEQNLYDLLLKAPTLTEEELNHFNKARDWMSQWEIKEF